MTNSSVENSQRNVSSESEELILVDIDDNETGYLSKAQAHDGTGSRLFACSVVLFNDEG